MGKIDKEFLDKLNQPTEDDKYVIFKREDWDHYMSPIEMGRMGVDPMNAIRLLEDRAIPDGTVIRRQDVFAPPALAAYANGIGVALAVEQVSSGMPREVNEVGRNLQRTADHFQRQSELAYEEHANGYGKLPD